MHLPKKSIHFIALSALVTCAVSVVPRRSEALMLLNPYEDFREDASQPALVVACVLMLPFCLLEEKVQVKQTSPRNLIDNGYTKKEVFEIQAGQTQVLAYMKLHQLDNSEQMEQAIAELSPQLSPAYVEFARECE